MGVGGGNVEEAGGGKGGGPGVAGGGGGMGRWGGLSQEERTASILKSPLLVSFTH